MLRTNHLNKLEIAVTQHSIRVTGDEGFFQLTLSEVEKATSVLVMTRRMRTLPAMPDSIGESPFTVTFFEDKSFAIQHDHKDGLLRVPLSEVQDVIDAVKIGGDMALDQKKIHGHAKIPPRGTLSNTINSEPVD